jgi:nucleoside-diphosphate-sugar epimerase
MIYKEIFENTYKEKKVLLTGHTGFKGSWMLAWLHQLGAEVKGYALHPENDNDHYNLINGEDQRGNTFFSAGFYFSFSRSAIGSSIV